jgi:hypothetical protein
MLIIYEIPRCRVAGVVLIVVIAQLVLAYVHAPQSATVNNDNT